MIYYARGVHRMYMRNLLPYAGIDRIRFNGTLSTPLQQSTPAIFYVNCFRIPGKRRKYTSNYNADKIFFMAISRPG